VTTKRSPPADRFWTGYRDDLAGAIDVVEQLEPTTYSAVSLAELYAETNRWEDVIELTEGLTKDDASALLLVFRGQAFREQAFHDAAHESLKQALRSRSREASIRHRARRACSELPSPR
jgi:hypothetical protein